MIQPQTTLGVDYNTQRPALPLPEYGRAIQQMVDYCKLLTNRDERQACAEAIVCLMRRQTEMLGSQEDMQTKLWSHLAAMAGYELDIDYPIAVARMDERPRPAEHIPYPGSRIKRPHYGHILEQLTALLTHSLLEPEQREALAFALANHMKRSLARFNRDAMNEERVVSDLADYTEGSVSLLPNEVPFRRDADIIADVQQMMPTKHKKRRQR